MSQGYPTGPGQGRSEDPEYAQSFASLSLSDCDPDSLAPRADYYNSSYTDTFGLSYGPPYPGQESHDFAGQSSHAPTQSSSATYGSAGAYGSPYSTTSATSPIRRGEYRTQPAGTRTHSSYTSYDTASIASSSVPSEGGGSGWSDSQSHGTAPSSAPSRRSHQTDVNNTILRQRPPNQLYQLPCELHDLAGCPTVFTGDDTQSWMDHVEAHFGGNFPSKLRCCKRSCSTDERCRGRNGS
jgi:hypothetical protein